MKNIPGFNAFKACICLPVICLSSSFTQDTIWARSTCPDAKPVPIIKHMGQISPDSDRIKVVFPWTNKGTETLEIAKVTRSCRCAQVEPSQGKITPGQTVEFVANVGVTEWSGNAAVSFAVFFKNRLDSPLYFKATFYRPSPLQGKPARLDFGRIDDTLKSFRDFKIEWAHDPNEADLQVLPNIFSAKGTASCHLLEKSRKLVRLPNSDRPTVRQEFIFTAFLRPELPTGDLRDTLYVPVILNNELEKVAVRVLGFYKGNLFATPAKLFAFIPDNEIPEAKLKVLLWRQDWVQAPEDVNATCDDSRLHLSFTKPKEDERKNLIGQVTVTLPEPLPSNRIEATIKVSCRMRHDSRTFDIPVKIIVAES